MAPRLHPVLVLALALVLGAARAQMPWPITPPPQGSPPEGRTVVFVDVTYDSLESIISDRNAFGAIVWLHFSWRDARALPTMTAATTAWAAPNGTCTTHCESRGTWAGGCCDGIWLPSIDIPNLSYILQESVYKHRIWVEPAAAGSGGDPTDIVHWTVRVTAEFHSPFDFRAWPFEHQHLLLELQVAQPQADRVSLTLNEVAFAQNTPHTKGEVIPGWRIAKVTPRVYDMSACYNRSAQATSLFTFNGSQAVFTALRPDGWAQLSTAAPGSTRSSLAPGACSGVRAAIAGGGALPVSPEALAQYSPVLIVIDVMVRRVKEYYLLSNVIPQLLLAYMVFVTYAMDRANLEARMGVVVTLVLAASALQFTWTFPPANFLNAVQQITLASYCLYFLVSVESMIAAHITRMHERRRYKESLAAVITRQKSTAAYTAPSSPGGTSTVGNSEFGGDWRDSGVDDGSASGTYGYPAGAQGREASYSRPSAAARAGFVGGMRRGGSVDLPAPGSTSNGGAGATFGGPNGANNGAVYCPAYPDRRQPPQPIAEGREPAVYGGTVSAFAREPSTDLGGRYDDGGASVANLSAYASAGMPAVRLPELKTGDCEVAVGVATGAAGKAGAAASKKGKRGGSSSGAFAHAASRQLAGAAAKTRRLGHRISKDEAFAKLLARRMDVAFCWGLLVAYTVVVAVLLYINTEIGDHRLMLQGDRPANA